MARLFITLYLMVLASFGVFMLFGSALEALGNGFWNSSTIDEEISIGTFKLLNESLQGLDEAQTSKKLLLYKKIFGPGFGLFDPSELKLSPDNLKQLDQGQRVVHLEEESIFITKKEATAYDSNNQNKNGETFTIVYFKHFNQRQIWRAYLDINASLTVNGSGVNTLIDAHAFSEGSMHLLMAKLNQEKPENWPEAIHSIENNFGIPLKITHKKQATNQLQQSSFKELQLSKLNDGEVANISQGSNYATFVKKIKGHHDQYLQIGPVEIPWFIRNYFYLMATAFALSFASMLFIWLWPLWSNLIRIKNAANEFGTGNYDVRIPPRKFSPIKKVTDAFNKMAEHTQRSIRSQKELTSAVSHELRTPVARMRFALEMLDTNTDKTDKARYIKTINEDINELDLLLEELLSYARFDQNNPSLNTTITKLHPWFNNSIEKLKPLAHNKHLKAQIKHLNTDEVGLFEARLMARVLDNLVQNALRYARSTVEVTLYQEQQQIVLTIEDDGEGIPKDKRKQIFNAFSRIDESRDRASGGFGLGLAIADRIVTAHHGNIFIDESQLGGARFEVRFPQNKNTNV